MEFIEDTAQHLQGVGASAEARLVPLKSLIEYYEREMGELPGRLMIATSFLGDVQFMVGWSSQSPEFRQAIEQAQSLVVSVMIRLLNMQGDCGDGGPDTELQHFLDSFPRRDREQG